MFFLETIEPALLVSCLKMRLRFLREGDIGASVPRRDLVALPALRQALQRVLADRDQQAKARLAPDLGLAHEAVLDESAQDIEHVVVFADLLDLRQPRARNEDCKPREETLLIVIEEIPAPPDRAAQGPLARR